MTKTATKTLPALKRDFLHDLISWAEGVEERKTRKHLRGHWYQVAYAYLDSEALREMSHDGVDIEDADVLGKEAPNYCGSAYCIAGQAVVSSGYALHFEDGVDEDQEATTSACVRARKIGTDEKGRPIIRPVRGAAPESIDGVARDLLGLTAMESVLLFSADNDVDDLKAMANAFCLRRDLPRMYEEDASAEEGHLDYLAAFER